MSRTHLLIASVMFAVAEPALAQCVEDSRPAKIGEDRVQIRAYACRQGASRIRVEFHRFNAASASSLLSGNDMGLLTRAIGAPRLLRNEVAADLTDIFDRFAETHETKYRPIKALVAVPGGGLASAEQVKKPPEVKVLSTDLEQNLLGLDYPAVRELRALSRGRKPESLKPAPNFTPSTYLTEKVWRFMTLQDLTRYEDNLAGYNQYFSKSTGKVLKSDSTIALMTHLAKEGLPEDFSVIEGFYYPQGGCDPYVGWEFKFLPRVPLLDGIIVENLSSSAVEIDAFKGTRTSGGLRTADVAASGPSSVIDLDLRLAPGDRVLIPTRLVFAPSDQLRKYTSSKYVYGPAFDVRGLVANSQDIDFDKRSANFTQLSLIQEEGSCPYLLSWKDEDDLWIQRGKILHAANGRDNEYREIVEFDGLRTRFRLEEREPEVAYIDKTKLIAYLDDGSILEMMPNKPQLADKDDEHIILAWGEFIEFSFSLPSQIDRGRVKRSELRVTGFYERYPKVRTVLRSVSDTQSSGRHGDGRAALMCREMRAEGRSPRREAGFLFEVNPEN